MSDWPAALGELVGVPAVLVTVARARGSAPRAAGTRMIVTAERIVGTIGGGNLEHQAGAIARQQLAAGAGHPSLHAFPLGARLGQCCGGHVELLFEPLTHDRARWLAQLGEARGMLVSVIDGPGAGGHLLVEPASARGNLRDERRQMMIVERARALLADNVDTSLERLDDQTLLFSQRTPPDFHIALFGAGHVGQALARVLAGLPCRLRWIDSRAEQFPQALPGNVTTLVSDEPELEVDDLPPASYIVVMTHSHPLDQAICQRALERGDYRYLGLIGSASKRARFEKRWRRAGIDDTAIAALTCPIGIGGIPGKHPGEIAVAVAAQILQVRSGSVATDRMTGSL